MADAIEKRVAHSEATNHDLTFFEETEDILTEIATALQAAHDCNAGLGAATVDALLAKLKEFGVEPEHL